MGGSFLRRDARAPDGLAVAGDAVFGIRRGRIDGDILALVKNLRFFKEFMALGREGQA